MYLQFAIRNLTSLLNPRARLTHTHTHKHTQTHTHTHTHTHQTEIQPSTQECLRLTVSFLYLTLVHPFLLHFIYVYTHFPFTYSIIFSGSRSFRWAMWWAECSKPQHTDSIKFPFTLRQDMQCYHLSQGPLDFSAEFSKRKPGGVFRASSARDCMWIQAHLQLQTKITRIQTGRTVRWHLRSCSSWEDIRHFGRI